MFEVLLISVKHNNKTNNTPIISNNAIKWQVGLQRLIMLRVQAEKKMLLPLVGAVEIHKERLIS